MAKYFDGIYTRSQIYNLKDKLNTVLQADENSSRGKAEIIYNGCNAIATGLQLAGKITSPTFAVAQALVTSTVAEANEAADDCIRLMQNAHRHLVNAHDYMNEGKQSSKAKIQIAYETINKVDLPVKVNVYAFYIDKTNTWREGGL